MLITTRQAADILHVSQTTVRNLCRAGRFPDLGGGTGPGGGFKHSLYDRAQVLAYKKSQVQPRAHRSKPNGAAGDPIAVPEFDRPVATAPPVVDLGKLLHRLVESTDQGNYNSSRCLDLLSQIVVQLTRLADAWTGVKHG